MTKVLGYRTSLKTSVIYCACAVLPAVLPFLNDAAKLFRTLVRERRWRHLVCVARCQLAPAAQ